METKRHSAIHPAELPTQRLSGTDKELEILDLLQRFDVLPSHYIQAWLGNTYSTRFYLTQLMEGHYAHLLRGKGVDCPTCGRRHPFSEDAWDYTKRRNVHYPLALWSRGEALLAKCGMWVDRPRDSDPFDHKMFRCVVQFSFAFGARELGITYGTLDDVLKHPSCHWKPTAKDTDPRHIPVKNMSALVPDDFVKLQGESAFFAHIEIDNGTETQSGHGTTIEDKVERFAAYIEHRDFMHRYGLPKIAVLFFFNQEGRLKTFLDVVKKVCRKQDVAQRFAGMYVPNFRKSFPPPTGWALGTYQRVGEPLNIMEIVNAKREGKEGGRPSENNQRGGSRVRENNGGLAA